MGFDRAIVAFKGFYSRLALELRVSMRSAQPFYFLVCFHI